jgi:Zn-finger nucleic acid-binding protein
MEAARARLDRKWEKRAMERRWAHYWNLCPKCGGDMFEQRETHLRFAVCRDCHGIYLDKAELDFARRFLDPKGVLAGLAKRARKPSTKVP